VPEYTHPYHLLNFAVQHDQPIIVSFFSVVGEATKKPGKEGVEGSAWPQIPLPPPVQRREVGLLIRRFLGCSRSSAYRLPDMQLTRPNRWIISRAPHESQNQPRSMQATLHDMRSCKREAHQGSCRHVIQLRPAVQLGRNLDHRRETFRNWPCALRSASQARADSRISNLPRTKHRVR